MLDRTAREGPGSGGRPTTLRIGSVTLAPILLLLLSACSLPFAGPGGPAPAVSTHEGDHLLVVCHFPCGETGEEALRTAETAWKLVAMYLGAGDGSNPTHPDASRPGTHAGPHGPESPDGRRPVVHLYGSHEDYAAVEHRVAEGRFRDTDAFASRPQRRAHVLTRVRPSGGAVPPGGLSLHERRIVAHEAAHLATFDLAHGAHWPRWLAEGLAGWVERELVASRGRGPVQEVNPWAGTQLWRVQRMKEAGVLPSISQVVTEGSLELSMGDAYALWTELFHFLVRGPFGPRIRTLVQQLARQPIPEDRAGPAVASRVEAVLGPDGLEELDAAFRHHVLGVRPDWVELVRSLEEIPGYPGRWFQRAIRDHPLGAVAWRTGDPGDAEEVRLRGVVEPRGPNPWEVRIPLERTEGDPLLLTLDARGEVLVRTFAYQAPDQLATLARGSLAGALPPHGEIAFTVHFRAGRLALEVDEHAGPVVFELPEARPTGLWGLGVAPGTSALWRDLEVEGTDGPADLAEDR